VNARRAFKTIGAKQLRGGCASPGKGGGAGAECVEGSQRLPRQISDKCVAAGGCGRGQGQGRGWAPTTTQIANCNKLERKWANDGDNGRDDGRFVCVSW